MVDLDRSVGIAVAIALATPTAILASEKNLFVFPSSHFSGAGRTLETLPPEYARQSLKSSISWQSQGNEGMEGGSSHKAEVLLKINSVDDLSDIPPEHWSREALDRLIRDYSCLSGYPDGTFRGNRTLTRYEFAVALNACVNAILREDTFLVVDTLPYPYERLQEEFAAELATLRSRIDSLEERSQLLEDRQFSTTTQLHGEASFALSSVFGEERADGGGLEEVPVFNNRVRLSFLTSFTGEDLLLTQLEAISAVPFGPGEEDEPNITGTHMTRTAFDEGNDNDIAIGELSYGFPVSDRLHVKVTATGGEFNESVVETFNELFEEELNGAISRFGRFNPIYYQGEEGAGISAIYSLTDDLHVSVGYLAPTANDPDEKNGLFNGSYAALAQIDFELAEETGIGLTYVRSYFPGEEVAVSGETGSELANAPFGEETATSADSFGLQGSIRLGDRLNLGGWMGLTIANAETDDIGVSEGDDATIFNWAVTLAFPDLGSEGSLGGITIGQPPKVTENDGGAEDEDTSWHIEAQYRYQFNDNMAINPGAFVILNPEHDSDRDPIWVGTLRLLFEF